MKQKLLSKLLAIAMVLTLLPAGVFAADTTVANDVGSDPTPTVEYVAQIGENKYTTLDEALSEWAANGGTLKLLQDGELTDKVTVKNTGTLDLNGKTLRTGVSQALYVDGGTLTIEDSSEDKSGVYESSNSRQIYINAGNVTLNSGTVKGAGGTAYGVVNVRRFNSSFTMNGGAVECTGTMTKDVLDTTKGYAIVGLGTKRSNPNQITINGGKVTSVGDAIYTKEGAVHYTIDGNAQVGCITIVATSSGYPTHLTFTGNAQIDGLTVTGKYLGSFTAENTVRFKSDISDALATTSYGCFAAEDGTYKVDQLTEENAVAAVIDNSNKVTYYGTLTGAAKNVGAGETVKLLKDCTSAYPVKVNDAAYGMTLDLNGHNITNTNTQSTTNALDLGFGSQNTYAPVKITNSGDTAATISAAIPVVATARQGAMAVEIEKNVILKSTVGQRQMKLEGSAYVDVSGKSDAEIEALGDLWKTADNKLFGNLSSAAKFSTGGNVTLVKDYTGSSDLTARNTCVVDFNGHTYNDQSKTDYVLAIDNGVSVTLKNGTLTSGTEHTGIITNGTDSDINLTLQDFTLSVPNGRGIYFPSSGSVTIENSVINAKHFGVQVCAGSLTVSGDKTAITATGAPQDKVENDGPIDDGAAVSIVNRAGYKDLGKVQILGGAFAASNASKAVKAYSFNNKNKTEDAWDNVKDTVSISGGYFTSNPNAYKVEGKFVVTSDKDGYSCMISDNAPAKAEVFVDDTTAVTKLTNENLTDADKTAIQKKTKVDGVAEAVAGSKDTIVEKAGVDASKVDATKLIEVEVAVDVAVSDVQKNEEGTAVSSITFTAKPTATVKVDGTAKDTKVPVTNDMLNNNPITVKLPLPADFVPKQIKHTSENYGVEYFINKDVTDVNKSGAKGFEVVDGCAVFTITHFSTFELSGDVTYVAPVYTSAPITKKDVKFDDVDVNAYYAPAVKWAVENKITAGKTDKLFAPDDTCTRGEMITFLWNAAGKPAAKNTTNPFTDVNAGAFYYDAVLWAVENGITSGTTDTTFSPDNTVNRAQVVAFLYNYANKPAAANSTFSDVAADAYYAPAVGWAAAQKITSGTGNNTFSPENDCTRAQIVTFLYNDLAK